MMYVHLYGFLTIKNGIQKYSLKLKKIVNKLKGAQFIQFG